MHSGLINLIRRIKMFDPGFDPHFSTKADSIKKEENKIIIRAKETLYTIIDKENEILISVGNDEPISLSMLSDQHIAVLSESTANSFQSLQELSKDSKSYFNEFLKHLLKILGEIHKRYDERMSAVKTLAEKYVKRINETNFSNFVKAILGLNIGKDILHVIDSAQGQTFKFIDNSELRMFMWNGAVRANVITAAFEVGNFSTIMQQINEEFQTTVVQKEETEMKAEKQTIAQKQETAVNNQTYTSIAKAVFVIGTEQCIKSDVKRAFGTVLIFNDDSRLWIFKSPDGIVRARLIDSDVPGLQVNKEPNSAISIQPMVDVNFGSAVVMHNGLDEVFVDFPCGKRLRMSCSPDGEVSISGSGRQLTLFNGHMAKFK